MCGALRCRWLVAGLDTVVGVLAAVECGCVFLWGNLAPGHGSLFSFLLNTEFNILMRRGLST